MRLGTDLLATGESRLDEWAMQRGALAELDAFLVREMPERILECGSGLSTLLLGRYARATGATVVTLEHQGRYYDRTAQWLAAEGLRERVDLRHVALDEHRWGPWYQTALPDDIDFALIDGPPESTGGRRRTFFEICPRLRSDGRWYVWLDDAHRPTEAQAVASWVDHFNVSARVLNIGRGLAQLCGPSAAYDGRAKRMGKFEAEDTAITILTGGRPQLLRRQLASLRIEAPGLLETARVHILVNGADPQTTEIAAALAATNSNITHEAQGHAGMWRIGPATSHLARWAYEQARSYWLHLEDDWEITTPHHGWFNEARTILQTDSDVCQVRLRHITEPVLTRHMHTREPITWRTFDNPAATYLHSPAHWTFNPSLVRTADIPGVFPADGERAAIRSANRHGLDRKIAQHTPGVFRHIGGADSLADRTRGR